MAHRGLTLDRFDENSREALQAAIEHQIEYLEIDIRASSDGVAYLLHDRDLLRVAGDKRQVSALSSKELDALTLSHGSHPLRLEDALHLFPTAKFNIDVKSTDAIGAVRSAIGNDLNRVLVTSFSDRRRRKTIAGVNVATSAGAITTLLVWLLQKNARLLGWALVRIDALQIPANWGWLRFDSESFIRAVKSHGVEVHYWVINDVELAKSLISRGADGIVSDRADLIKAALAE